MDSGLSLDSSLFSSLLLKLRVSLFEGLIVLVVLLARKAASGIAPELMTVKSFARNRLLRSALLKIALEKS